MRKFARAARQSDWGSVALGDFTLWRSCVAPCLAILALVLSLLLNRPSPAQAETYAALPVLRIGNDRGGSLRTRIAQIQDLRRSGQPVAVTGRICYSTCTLFLGLPQTCVSRDTIFGFHGPSSYGRPLEPPVFERASALIVAHYPEGLRDWYMSTARHSLSGMYRIKGDALIALGVRAC